MRYPAERSQTVAIAQEMARSGLVVATAGNISIRVGDSQVAITPSRLPYATMTADDICVVDLDGNSVEGSANPSSEMQLHLDVYRSSDAQAVVHTHSQAAAAVSTLVTELPAIHYYINQLGGAPIRVAPYSTFGTKALAVDVVAALDERTGALMANHGAVTVGGTLDEAYSRAVVLEWLCQVWLTASAAGNPRLLTPEGLAAAQERRHHTVYQQMQHEALQATIADHDRNHTP